MERLKEACAADHCRIHYGNFQLEKPESQSWQSCWMDSLHQHRSACAALSVTSTPAMLGGYLVRTDFIQYVSPGTKTKSELKISCKSQLEFRQN